jgi:hypothetical protein
VGEKLRHFVEAAEHHPEFAQELPYFVAEIKLNACSASPRSATTRCTNRAYPAA